MSSIKDFKDYVHMLQNERRAHKQRFDNDDTKRNVEMFDRWRKGYADMFMDLKKQFRRDPDAYPKELMHLLDKDVFKRKIKTGMLYDPDGVREIKTVEDLDKHLFGRKSRKTRKSKTRRSRRRFSRRHGFGKGIRIPDKQCEMCSQKACQHVVNDRLHDYFSCKKHRIHKKDIAFLRYRVIFDVCQN
jgi:hypothetical protein